MPEYVNPPFVIDPSSIEQGMYDYIQTVFPDWEPRDAHAIKIVSEAFAEQISDLMRIATDVPPAIFRYFGRLIGVIPIEAQAAVGSTTWTMIDNAGYLIPEGTGVRFLVGGGNYEAFVTTDDVVVPGGSTTTAIGEVPIRAVNEGVTASGLNTAPELTDVLDYILSVSLVGSTSGGSDAETDDQYLTRLSDRLTLLADHPVIPDDFITYTNTIPGVARSLALDGYNPATGTFNNDKMITMVAIDSSGLGVPGPTKTAILALLTAAREVNFDPHVIDPTYTVVTIVSSVKALPGFDLVDLKARVEAAVDAYINPGVWGLNIQGDDTIWVLENKVRFTNIVTVIENVAGVNYIVPGTLLINGAAADFTLTGVAPLPDLASTVTITSVAA